MADMQHVDEITLGTLESTEALAAAVNTTRVHIVVYAEGSEVHSFEYTGSPSDVGDQLEGRGVNLDEQDGDKLRYGRAWQEPGLGWQIFAIDPDIQAELQKLTRQADATTP